MPITTGTLNLTLLRQNFIKNHKFKSSYFLSLSNHPIKISPTQMEAFSDRKIFHPREYQTITNIQRCPQSTYKSKKSLPKQQKSLTSPSTPPRRNDMNILSNKLHHPNKNQVNWEVPVESVRAINYNYLGCQLVFVKVEKIKRRAMNARMGSNRIQRYSKYANYLYIMLQCSKGPCNIESIKINTRPTTALDKQKGSTNKNQYRARMKNQVQFGWGKYETLQPWEVEVEDAGMGEE